MKKQSQSYTLLLIVMAAVLIISASVAVPLVWRGFYYLHIDALHLPEKTGWTAAEIRAAFDEMMDFCVFREDFGTGVMKWSEEGRSHFADCELLFRLDFTVLAVALAGVLLLWHMGREYEAVSFGRRGPLFWAGAVPAVVFAAVAGLAALDFDRAFVIFHSLFFPGKSNWIFDYRVDEIILVLPQVVFRNYGILIVGLLLVLCAGLMLFDRQKR